MAAKLVLATRRFQREYPRFLRKYTDLKPNFRNFLSFRATARPDQSFNAKDSRVPKTKLWHCHLIHGKAILIYQLHGAELRLISINDHNAIESGSSTTVRDYARRLTRDDYYRFDIDGRAASLDNPNPDSDPGPDPDPDDGDAPEEDDPPETILDQPEPDAVIPVARPTNPLWSERVVHYLRDQQLLYQPKPSHPMIVLRLTKELIAPKGDVLVIDTVAHSVYHLTEDELSASFEPAEQSAKTIGEAVAASVPRRQPLPQPNHLPSPEPKPAPGSWRAKREHGVGPQIGRLIMTFAHLQANQGGTKFDTATISHHMHERDQRSLSALMVHAQTAGLIKKAGKKTGRGYYYSLTSAGERTSKTLGDWPYTVAGMPLPKTSPKRD